MSVVSSLSFALGEETDTSGTTPVADLIVSFDTAALPEFPETISIERTIYDYYWNFSRVLGGIPHFLADKPATLFEFEWESWCTEPRNKDSVLFVWRQRCRGDDDRYPPTPVAKLPLARALIRYCETASQFNSESVMKRAPLRCAQSAVEMFERGEPVPNEELAVTAYLLSDGNAHLELPNILELLRDEDLLDAVMKNIRNSDPGLAAAGYRQLFKRGDHREAAVKRLVENPDPKLAEAGRLRFDQMNNDLTAKLATALIQSIKASPRLQSLNSTDEHPIIDLIFNLTFHEDPRVRRQAVEVIQLSVNPFSDGENPLVEDEDQRVQQAAREVWD